MKPILYAHPFSSYCQKVLTALYENDTPFDYKVLDGDEALSREFAALWPIKRFPILVEDGRTIMEATIIIEYLDQHYPGVTKFIPSDPDLALEVRRLDRFFDNYIQTPQQRIIFNALRPEEHRDPYGVTEALGQLETMYAWLDGYLKGRTWAVGESFSLADCSASPALFYCDWTHRIDAKFTHLHAYRARLLKRPSFARAVDEGRRFRHYFPLGAPDRD